MLEHNSVDCRVTDVCPKQTLAKLFARLPPSSLPRRGKSGGKTCLLIVGFSRHRWPAREYRGEHRCRSGHSYGLFTQICSLKRSSNFSRTTARLAGHTLALAQSPCIAPGLTALARLGVRHPSQALSVRAAKLAPDLATRRRHRAKTLCPVHEYHYFFADAHPLGVG